MISLDVAIRYKGGLADEHQLNLYDAAESLRGLARSLILPAHYLANGDIVHQAPFAKHVQVRLTASRPGSFESLVTLLLDPQNGPLVGVAAATATAAVEEFFRYLFKKIVGSEEKLKHQTTKNIIENHEPAIDALGDAIENDIVNVHRPIITGSNNIVIIGNNAKLVTLDQGTYDYAKTTIRDKDSEVRIGRISAFNANSQRGRIYDSNLRRTVPFQPIDSFSDPEAQLIAWSLTQYVHDQPGNIALEVHAIRGLNGDVKRYAVVGVSDVPQRRRVRD